MSNQKKKKAPSKATIKWLGETLFVKYNGVLPRKADSNGFHGEMRRLGAVPYYDEVKRVARMLDHFYLVAQSDYPTVPWTREKMLRAVVDFRWTPSGSLTMDELADLGDTAAVEFLQVLSGGGVDE